MILKQLILMKIELLGETFSDFAAEFIVYKLKEMGKIDEKDIAGIMEEFEQLDYDESGNLTNSDIVLAQTTSQIQR
ncbi:unnamed protein product [Eruca vesicaria subsp. sativa]|uniref:Uncharacterized protein n=1 Tax=Eruca vesicaria subsp. sativa TaxID=29727 RepID=A0ABC8JDR0_ERUVS|nr:unnamed protein product [Eruca vesicaria subsp. sativa]